MQARLQREIEASDCRMDQLVYVIGGFVGCLGLCWLEYVNGRNWRPRVGMQEVDRATPEAYLGIGVYVHRVNGF